MRKVLMNSSLEEMVYAKIKSILGTRVKVVDKNRTNCRGKTYIGLHPRDGEYIQGFNYEDFWAGYGTIDCVASNEGVYVNFYDGHGKCHYGPYITKFTLSGNIDYLLKDFCNEIFRNLHIVAIPKKK